MAKVSFKDAGLTHECDPTKPLGIFDCAVCGGPCRWIDRDDNHKDIWGFYCDNCAVFSESDVEVED